MPVVLYTPTPEHTRNVFRPEVYAALGREFDLRENTLGRPMTVDDVVQGIGDADALVTGWGTCALTAPVFDAAPRLRLIAHSAGSVRAILTPDLIERYVRPRGIVVFSANRAIALNVAEATIGLLIMASRRWVEHIQHVRGGGWRTPEIPGNGQYLSGATVGVVSASTIGRLVCGMLRVFDTRVLVYDPYADPEAIAALGAERVELDALFERSDLVTVHTPKLAETDGLIGRRQLSLLRDGAVLINTSRGSVIDEAALIEECRTGRIYAALDVTEPEPPAADSELRSLPNVYVLPHIAGAGYYGYFEIGSSTLRALRDHFAGLPVSGAVPLERFAEIA